MKIVSVGEFLWDVFDVGERLGGAPFNFAAQAQRLGHEVSLVAAVGHDERGRKALAGLRDAQLSTRFVSVLSQYATGVVRVSVDQHGQPTFLIEGPCAYHRMTLSEADLAALVGLAPDWLYFGTMHRIDPAGQAGTERIFATLPQTRRFYDVNLRPGNHTPQLVLEQLPGCQVVKMNEEEAAAIAAMLGWPVSSPAEFLRRAAQTFAWTAASVTLGERGCVLMQGGELAEAPGFSVEVVDTVGAGDAFAAAFLHGLDLGWPLREIAAFANRAGARVASHSGAVAS